MALQAAIAANPSPHVMAGLLEGLSHFHDPQAEAILEQQSKTGATDEIRDTAARWLKTMQAKQEQ
jgi:hypothetical protein